MENENMLCRAARVTFSNIFSFTQKCMKALLNINEDGANLMKLEKISFEPWEQGVKNTNEIMPFIAVYACSISDSDKE